MSLVFSPFLFSSSSSRLLTIVVIQNAFTLSLSLYIYTEYIESDDFPTFRFFYERKEERAFAKHHRDQLLYIVVVLLFPPFGRFEMMMR